MWLNFSLPEVSQLAGALLYVQHEAPEQGGEEHEHGQGEEEHEQGGRNIDKEPPHLQKYTKVYLSPCRRVG